MLIKFLDWLYEHNRIFSAWVNQKVMEDVTAFKKRSRAQKKAKGAVPKVKAGIKIAEEAAKGEG